MDNPMLVPLAGGLAILLLLGLLLQLRRRAGRLPAEDGTAVEDGTGSGDDRDGAPADQHLDDDVVPMLTYDDDLDDDLEGADDASGPAGEQVERPEPIEVDAPGADPWSTEVPPGPEPVNVRYLRAQVRTLQETLEKVQDVPAGGGADMVRFRRQITAALRGLGERTREDESPERTLARVVATIERLDAPDAVARPVLPTVKFDLSGAQMTLGGPQDVAAPAALAQASVVTAPAPAPAAAPAPAPEPAMAVAAAAPAPAAPAAPAPAPEAPAVPAPAVTTPLASALAAGSHDELDGHPAAQGLTADPFAQDGQVLPPPAEPDVVLPVPPPATSGDQRSRRWSRRHGA